VGTQAAFLSQTKLPVLHGLPTTIAVQVLPSPAKTGLAAAFEAARIVVTGGIVGAVVQAQRAFIDVLARVTSRGALFVARATAHLAVTGQAFFARAGIPRIGLGAGGILAAGWDAGQARIGLGRHGAGFAVAFKTRFAGALVAARVVAARSKLL
jgi:hypothetical protein